MTTPGRQVLYEGDTRISGVPGTAAGIQLSFLDVVGTKTGDAGPTGQVQETIDGIAETSSSCDSQALIAAEEFGLNRNETPAELATNGPMLARLESIRREPEDA